MDTAPFDPELVREKMRELGITQAAMARALGFPSQSAVSNLLTTNPKQKPRKATAQEARDIYRFLGIEPESQVQYVPIIGFASAGAWGEAISRTKEFRPIPKGIGGRNAFAVELVGDSMDKLLPGGGWAVVDPDKRELLVGRIYLIENGDHETTVKMYAGEPARFEPCSHNPSHKPLLLHEADYRVIGRVVTYGRDAP